MTQSVFETTATALREKSKLRRHFRRFGVLFYFLGGKTRRETAAEPVASAYVPADHHEPAP